MKSIKISLKLLLLIASAAGLSADKFEDVQSYAFPVSNGEILEIKVSDADVSVTGKPGLTEAEIIIKKSVKAKDEDSARELFDSQPYDCRKDGNKVILKSLKPVKVNSLLGWQNGIRTDIVISIPEVFEVDVRTSDGDLVVTHVDGPVALLTSDGDVGVNEVKGNLVVRSSDGDIVVDNINGDVKAQTSDGDVSLGNIHGNVDTRTSDGDLMMEEIFGSITCQSSDGDIEASFASSPVSDCRFQTSDGDVELTIPSGEDLNYDLSTTDGGISFPFSAEHVDLGDDRQRIKTVGNQGRPMIRVRTSDGEIQVLQAN